MIRKLTHQEILSRQQEKIAEKRLPFHVILNNIRSLYNVGSIFRTADGAGVAKIWICGITGHPPDKQIAKTALGAEQSVLWEYRENIAAVVDELKKQDFKIHLLEQTQKSVPYQKFKAKAPVCLIVGNEIEGVASQVLSLCDGAIEIDMAGIKNSLNVAVAFGIVAYHIKNHLKSD